MLFIETLVFTRQIKALINDDDYRCLQEALALNPEAGPVIAGTGGLRKIRIAAKGHGKRGGARVIYYHFDQKQQIAMLCAYAKNEQIDLSAGQTKALAAIIAGWR